MSEPRDDAERLARVRQYVQNNLDVWSEDDSGGSQSRADALARAYADIYQKVLNVIDTGHPMTKGDDPA